MSAHIKYYRRTSPHVHFWPQLCCFKTCISFRFLDASHLIGTNAIRDVDCELRSDFFFFFCVLKAGQPLPSLVWRMRCAYSPKRIPKSIQYRCLAMSLKHIFLYFSETLLVFHVTNQLLVDLINCKIFLKLFFFSIRYFSSFLFLTVAAFEGSCCHQIQNLVIFS